MQIPCALVTVYLVILILRAVFSWFPVPEGGAATFYRILLDLTEPVLAPVRRVLPSTGGFDFSPLLVLLAIRLLQRLL